MFVRSSESAGTGTRPFISLAVYDEESSRMQCVSIEELSVVYSSDALRAAAILPVCLSVCLSVTLMDCVEMAKLTIKRFTT